MPDTGFTIKQFPDISMYFGGVVAVWTKQRLPASRDPEGDARPLRASTEGEYVSSSDGLRGSASMSYSSGSIST